MLQRDAIFDGSISVLLEKGGPHIDLHIFGTPTTLGDLRNTNDVFFMTQEFQVSKDRG